jgi:proline dehydrogenase
MSHSTQALFQQEALIARVVTGFRERWNRRSSWIMRALGRRGSEYSFKILPSIRRGLTDGRYDPTSEIRMMTESWMPADTVNSLAVARDLQEALPHIRPDLPWKVTYGDHFINLSLITKPETIKRIIKTPALRKKKFALILGDTPSLDFLRQEDMEGKDAFPVAFGQILAHSENAPVPEDIPNLKKVGKGPAAVESFLQNLAQAIARQENLAVFLRSQGLNVPDSLETLSAEDLLIISDIDGTYVSYHETLEESLTGAVLRSALKDLTLQLTTQGVHWRFLSGKSVDEVIAILKWNDLDRLVIPLAKELRRLGIPMDRIGYFGMMGSQEISLNADGQAVFAAADLGTNWRPLSPQDQEKISEIARASIIRHSYPHASHWATQAGTSSKHLSQRSLKKVSAAEIEPPFSLEDPLQRVFGTLDRPAPTAWPAWALEEWVSLQENGTLQAASRRVLLIIRLLAAEKGVTPAEVTQKMEPRMEVVFTGWYARLEEWAQLPLERGDIGDEAWNLANRIFRGISQATGIDQGLLRNSYVSPTSRPVRSTRRSKFRLPNQQTAEQRIVSEIESIELETRLMREDRRPEDAVYAMIRTRLSRLREQDIQTLSRVLRRGEVVILIDGKFRDTSSWSVFIRSLEPLETPALERKRRLPGQGSSLKAGPGSSNFLGLASALAMAWAFLVVVYGTATVMRRDFLERTLIGRWPQWMYSPLRTYLLDLSSRVKPAHPLEFYFALGTHPGFAAHTPVFERRIQEFGRKLLQAAPREKLQHRLQNKILDLSMRYPRMKILFKGVENLGGVRILMGFIISGSLIAISWIGPIGWILAGGELLFGLTFEAVTYWMSRRFIASPSLKSVIDELNEWGEQGIDTTLDRIGERIQWDEEGERNTQDIIQTLNTLGQSTHTRYQWNDNIPKDHVSIKLTNLVAHPDIDREKAMERLRQILRAAIRADAFVRIDMEEDRFRRLTLGMYKQLLEEDEFASSSHRIGIVLQAYMRDSYTIALELVELARDRKARGWGPVSIRLVKGAYWEDEVDSAMEVNKHPPVWYMPNASASKRITDANYEVIAELLLKYQKDGLVLAFATHNVYTIATIMALADRYGVKPDFFEFQMLYGMGDSLKYALRKLGYHVRVYIPWGNRRKGAAYQARRLEENSSEQGIVAQSRSIDPHDEAAVTELLLPWYLFIPQELVRDNPSIFKGVWPTRANYLGSEGKAAVVTFPTGGRRGTDDASGFALTEIALGITIAGIAGFHPALWNGLIIFSAGVLGIIVAPKFNRMLKYMQRKKQETKHELIGYRGLRLTQILEKRIAYSLQQLRYVRKGRRPMQRFLHRAA